VEQIEIEIDGIDFKTGLIPAIVQDYRSKAVLMLAYMNAEALRLSLETGETHFWSRSRKKLWRKGETSGHIQKIKKIAVDCDQDTLLLEVEQVGVACHTGAPSCFFRELDSTGRLEAHRGRVPDTPQSQSSVLEALSKTIEERKRHPTKASYTRTLMDGGIDRILKKVGEESAEFLLGAKNGDKKEIVHEAADLIYHLLVALCYFDIPFRAIEAELAGRRAQSGLEEKYARKGIQKKTKSSSEEEEEA